MFNPGEWCWCPNGHGEKVLVKLKCLANTYSGLWQVNQGDAYEIISYAHECHLTKATDSEIVLWNLEN